PLLSFALGEFAGVQCTPLLGNKKNYQYFVGDGFPVPYVRFALVDFSERIQCVPYRDIDGFALSMRFGEGARPYRNKTPYCHSEEV
ncbi:MAG: hypothetical protein RR052_06315, partial [Oscillospiraceae bacterium]